MLKSQKPDRGIDRDRFVPPVVFRSRRERVCDTVCDMHECVISGCAGPETVAYLMDRLLSLDPRYTGDRR
ncbi:MAG: hypothetical protein RLZZ444_2608 [Pseudomonadota bacterium]|jgi:hypothetical protein